MGRELVRLLQPWPRDGPAAAIDSTVLAARGGVWHRQHREQGVVPHTSIDTEAHRTKSAGHGRVYGWKLHRGRYPHHDEGVDVRRLFHQVRSHAIENVNEQFKAIFDVHGPVPTGARRHPAPRPRRRLRHQLLLLHRSRRDDLRVGLKACLRAA